MDLALQHGCRSLWILHNKALALSFLQRFDLAHTLWEGLIQHDNVPAFVAGAEEAYRASEQRERRIQSTPLLQALIGRIQQDHLQPQVLPASGELSDDADLQTLVLQEAETLRNQDQAQLSLEILNFPLITAAIRSGCCITKPWPCKSWGNWKPPLLSGTACRITILRGSATMFKQPLASPSRS